MTTPCLGCGHAQRNHISGVGLCLVRSCRLCLSYRPNNNGPGADTPGPVQAAEEGDR